MAFERSAPLATPNFGDLPLLPAIAQQYETGEVLMLAWMNREAFAETLATRRPVTGRGRVANSGARGRGPDTYSIWSGAAPTATTIQFSCSSIRSAQPATRDGGHASSRTPYNHNPGASRMTEGHGCRCSKEDDEPDL